MIIVAALVLRLRIFLVPRVFFYIAEIPHCVLSLTKLAQQTF